MPKIKTYKAEYENEQFEVFTASNHKKAIEEALAMEGENGTLFYVFLLDEEYNEVKTIF